MFLSKVISSVLEIVVMGFIPFIWWLITAKKENFFSWIGLKKWNRENTKEVVFWILGIAAGFMIFSVYLLSIVLHAENATSEFSGLGIGALPTVLVYAIFNTSLPEEILFRGFLLKRLKNKFGFVAANVIQSVIFSMIHGLLFMGTVNVVKLVAILAFTGLIAWFMGTVNEKKANGSILPGWGVHAAANILSGMCSAFLA